MGIPNPRQRKWVSKSGSEGYKDPQGTYTVEKLASISPHPREGTVWVLVRRMLPAQPQQGLSEFGRVWGPGELEGTPLPVQLCSCPR